MKSLCLIIALFSIPFSFYAQNVEWNQNYGGSGNEFFLSAQKIFSRYYCFGASTSSDHTLNGNYGGYDGWFFAINDDGNPALSFYFGGDQDDFLRDGIQANENAILMCGFTESTNGTFLGLDSYGEKDGFVQAVDSFGSEIYTKKYGGTSDDFLNKIIHTNNGGYLIAGTSKSSDNDLPGNNGQNDIWLLRLGSSMETVWSYNYGGPGYDEALDVLALDDGSFLVSGSTNSSVFSTSGTTTQTNFFLMKINSLGQKQWEKVFGSSGPDIPQGMKLLSNNNILIYGSVRNGFDEVEQYYGGLDIWLLEVDNLGNQVWQNTIGWENDEIVTDVVEYSPEDFLILASSSDTLHMQNNGETDQCLFYADSSSFNLISNYGGESFDGTNEAPFSSMYYNENQNSIIVFSQSNSTTGPLANNYGDFDYWIYKINNIITDNTKPFISDHNNIKVYPNPASDYIIIDVDKKIANGDYQIIDLWGRSICSGTIQNQTEKIHTHSLKKGIYILKLSKGNNSVQKKLIIK